MSTNGFLIHEARRKGRGRRFFTREKRKKKGNGGCFFFCSISWRQHSSEFPLAIPHYFFLPFSTEKVDWGGNKFILCSDGRINGSKRGRKMALLGTNLSFLLILQKRVNSLLVSVRLNRMFCQVEFREITKSRGTFETASEVRG